MRRLGEIEPQIGCGDAGTALRMLLVVAALGKRSVRIWQGNPTVTCRVCDTEPNLNDLLVGDGQVMCGTCRTVFYQDSDLARVGAHSGEASESGNGAR